MRHGRTAGSAGRGNSEAGSAWGSSSEDGRIRKGRRGAITSPGSEGQGIERLSPGTFRSLRRRGDSVPRGTEPGYGLGGGRNCAMCFLPAPGLLCSSRPPLSLLVSAVPLRHLSSYCAGQGSSGAPPRALLRDSGAFFPEAREEGHSRRHLHEPPGNWRGGKGTVRCGGRGNAGNRQDRGGVTPDAGPWAGTSVLHGVERGGTRPGDTEGAEEHGGAWEGKVLPGERGGSGKPGIHRGAASRKCEERAFLKACQVSGCGGIYEEMLPGTHGGVWRAGGRWAGKSGRDLGRAGAGG